MGARPPRPADPEETQLADVVTELAIAAGIEPPRVLLYDDGPANALVFGRDPITRRSWSGAACSTSSTARRPRAWWRALIALRRGRRSRAGGRHRGRLRHLRPDDRRRSSAVVSPSATGAGWRAAVGPLIGPRSRSRLARRRASPPCSGCRPTTTRPIRRRSRLPDPDHDGWVHRRGRVAHQPVPERTAADLRLALARLPGRRDRGRADPRCRRPRSCADRARRRWPRACRARPGWSCCWWSAAQRRRVAGRSRPAAVRHRPGDSLAPPTRRSASHGSGRWAPIVGPAERPSGLRERTRGAQSACRSRSPADRHPSRSSPCSRSCSSIAVVLIVYLVAFAAFVVLAIVAGPLHELLRSLAGR